MDLALLEPLYQIDIIDIISHFNFGPPIICLITYLIFVIKNLPDRTDFNKQRQTINNLTQTINNLTQTNNELKQTNENLTQTNDNLTQTNNELEQTNDNLTQTNNEQRLTIDEQRLTIDEHTYEIDEQKVTIDEQEEINENLTQTNSELEQQTQTANERLSTLSNENDDLKTTTHKLSLDIHTEKGALVKARSRISSLETDLVSVRSRMVSDEVKEENDKIIKANKKIKKEIKKIEEKNNQFIANMIVKITDLREKFNEQYCDDEQKERDIVDENELITAIDTLMNRFNDIPSKKSIKPNKSTDAHLSKINKHNILYVVGTLMGAQKFTTFVDEIREKLVIPSYYDDYKLKPLIRPILDKLVRNNKISFQQIAKGKHKKYQKFDNFSYPQNVI